MRLLCPALRGCLGMYRRTLVLLWCRCILCCLVVGSGVQRSFGRILLLFFHALIVQRFASLHVLTPHTTGGSRESSPSPVARGCRELASQVQRARLSCAGAESRMRNPHITVSGAIRVKRAATEPRCGELGDRQVRRAGSRSEGHV